MATKPLNHREYTVGYVCVLHEEMVATVAMLDEVFDDKNYHVLGRVGV